MPSSVVLPPVECSRGTNPSQAAKSLARRNWLPSPALATNAVATRGPIPGTVISRRARSSRLARASISRVTSAMRFSSSTRSSNSRATVEIIDRLFGLPVEIVESGVARRVSTLEAILMRLWAAEMSGSKRAGRVRLQFLELVTKDAKEREVIVEAILAENLLDAAE